MERGFLMDANQEGVQPTFWASGKAWAYLLGMSKAQEVATYCCENCGLLESYALTAEQRKQHQNGGDRQHSESRSADRHGDSSTSAAPVTSASRGSNGHKNLRDGNANGSTNGNSNANPDQPASSPR